MKKIILASGSPRRKELLTQIGLEFTVVKSDIEEKVDMSLLVMDIPKELSCQKAVDVCQKINSEGCVIIGADTIVSFQGDILGKPKDEEDAFRMLKLLAGNIHQVYTGVTFAYLHNGVVEHHSFSECTNVEVLPMSDEEIKEYIKTGEPLDKAGAYGIQGIFAKFIKGIQGDYYNVVGLPVSLVYTILKKI